MGNLLFKKPNEPEEKEGSICRDYLIDDTSKQQEQYCYALTETPAVMQVMNSLSYKPITLIQYPPITNSFFYLINGTQLYVVADNDKQSVHFIQYSNDQQNSNDTGITVPTKSITLSLKEWLVLQSSKVRNISWYVKNDQYSSKLLPILTKPNCSNENFGNTALFFAKDGETHQVYACLSKINDDDDDFDLKETMVMTLSSWFGILDCVQLVNEKMGIKTIEEGNNNTSTLKRSEFVNDPETTKKAKVQDPIVLSRVKTSKKQKRKQLQPTRKSTRK